VAPDHDWWGFGYSECLKDCGKDWCDHSPDQQMQVHGGLTYAADCSGNEETGICHVPAPGREHDVWWFGFDCSHWRDVAPGMPSTFFPGMSGDAVYRTVEYVKDQCANLARQLAEVQS